MESIPLETRVLIVGAGMAGLAAASDLQDKGVDVLVIDKSHKVGGRLASKRIGPARFDYGAQFMTAREPRFLSLVEGLERAGFLKQWFTSYPGEKNGHPRWCGSGKMTAISQYLAESVALRTGHRLATLAHTDERWLARMTSGVTIRADAILLTPPVPQILTIMEDSGLFLQDDITRRLKRIKYEKCLAVLAQLDEPSAITPPGGIRFPEGDISWLADNRLKGISPVPSVTIHGAPHFSEQRWDLDRQESGELLLKAAQPLLGAEVSSFQVHGWRYAKPISIDTDRCLVVSHTPPLLLAGDAFGGPRVEGAALSGWKAAEILADLLH